jgi:hypothetical protein
MALGASCAHTRSTDSGETKEGDKAKEGDKQASGKKKAAEPGAGTNPNLHPGHPEEIPVATRPEALLAPGADNDIRDKLAERGFLKEGAGTSQSATREGLRRFQRAEDLPATGVADQETVKRLGLDPEKVFRKATVKD